MHWVVFRRVSAALVVMTCLIGGTALAVPFEIGTYDLGNHPEGNAADPLYGARLDNLFPGSAPFTFDFECADCGMFMDYDGSSVHIYGRAFGGQHDGLGGRVDDDFDGLYDFDVTYGGIVPVENDGTGLQDIGRPGETGAQIGTLTFFSGTSGDPAPSATMWDLMDKAGSHPNSLRVGNEDDDQGHRDVPGISGWGWLKIRETGSGDDFDAPGGSQDWLFTARRTSTVPEPGSTALLLIGLAAVAIRRRRN